ncbi:hypothetical protein [Kitasatospora kifunensis]|uniref:Uncharacterized protein n=1 Tax=Kitasatospora kifunensis TaxID=58351 RepID=A0A7W7R7H8_KITKI|nr:hypothetical protein [Kitasatospora kifunensis]MBB4926543.1 hypothetical protein [Kitasatospora kifunensis]
MDIVSAGTITEAITAAAGAAGTAAGRQAWEALLTVARRARRRGAGESAEIEPASVDPGSEPQVRELIATLVEDREDDPTLADDLTAWARRHAAALNVTVTYDNSTDNSTVTNVIKDNARVTKVIQGRDISGTFNFN